MAITTARLRLRQLRESDLLPFAALNADPRVMEFFPGLLSREESDAAAGRIAAHFQEHGFGRWAVEVPSVDAFIGFAGLSFVNFEASFTPCVEVSWRLAFDYWGHGYATEAARAAIEDGFTRLNLPEIVTFTAVANARSRRVMEKLGMRRCEEEDFDHPLLPVGHPLRPHVFYRLEKEEWQSENAEAES
jgi:RimJ/RimL family protein N-acetyltransferase